MNRTKAFWPAENAAVLRLLDCLLPGKNVKDFSFHFPVEGAATMKAEILIDENDVENIISVIKNFELREIVKEEDDDRNVYSRDHQA